MIKGRTRGLRWAVGLPVVLPALAAGGLEYVGVLGGNIRVVDPGGVYRSAQLSGPRLTDLIQSRGIQSVVNLRGPSDADAALRAERAVCAQPSVKHSDVRLSAYRLPPPAELRRLLQAFDSLPRPMLVHCLGGADRSGLACTLYLSIYRGVPLDEAESEQLTWRYGHIPGGKAHPMDDFFTLYRTTANGQSLPKWIIDSYPKLYSTKTNEGKLLQQDHWSGFRR